MSDFAMTFRTNPYSTYAPSSRLELKVPTVGTATLETELSHFPPDEYTGQRGDVRLLENTNTTREKLLTRITSGAKNSGVTTVQVDAGSGLGRLMHGPPEFSWTTASGARSVTHAFEKLPSSVQDIVSGFAHLAGAPGAARDEMKMAERLARIIR